MLEDEIETVDNEKKLFYVNSNQKGSAATLISQIDGKSKGNAS